MAISKSFRLQTNTGTWKKVKQWGTPVDTAISEEERWEKRGKLLSDFAKMATTAAAAANSSICG